METVNAASQIANSQVVWSILCILMTAYVLWHSNKRETRLLNNLDSLTKSQEKISENLERVEQRMDRMEKHIYKERD